MKPIIFSTPMVKAILAGNKTQTRRVIKPQPKSKMVKFEYGNLVGYQMISSCWNEVARHKPPYKPGDVLYVRETFAKYTDSIGTGYAYAAPPIFENYDCEPDEVDWNWSPSIHMPREAARIFLKVVDVRVERLQDISENGAIAEGIRHECGDCTECEGESAGKNCTDYCLSFAELWDSIHAKRPEFQWNRNPWVWVITFERTEEL